MRIGVIADIHGNSSGLSAVFADMERLNIEHILIAGDFVGYYPYVNEAFSLLRSKNVTCVLGNHDCYLLDRISVSEDLRLSYKLDYIERIISENNMEWLSGLPVLRRFELGGLNWILCHGSPWSIEEYIYPDSSDLERFAELEADIVVMGHSHIPMVHRAGDVLLVNPGSCGQPRDYNPLASYAVVETEIREVEIRRVPYDVNTVCKRLAEEGYEQELIDILTRTSGE
ncbi:MAG: YfcE family phosphodiesterase [Candidatus Aegiribacteria sp.]|nr:YfcE family phosphodiesterase [Candidatus Aegiribacteria sp.]